MADLFQPAHDAYVLWGVDTYDEDDEAPVALSGLTPTLAGYIKSTPELSEGRNNSLAFVIGSAQAQYKKLGAKNPTLGFTMHATSLGLLQKGARVNGKLPYLYFIVGVAGQWARLIRGCKIEQTQWNFKAAAEGEAAELETQLQISAIDIASSNPTPLTLAALATSMAALTQPFYWHDVSGIAVAGVAHRNRFMNVSITHKHNLERKGQRYDDGSEWGRTNYGLLEHHENVNGEVSLHGEPPSWFDGTGALEIAVGKLGVPAWTLTASNVFATNATTSSVESSGQIGSAIPFSARGLTLTPA